MEQAVLVVDDQPDNIKTITLLLKNMGLGKNIYSAPNGKIALELAEKFHPTLILSDWEMPEMNGIELVRALKESQRTKDIPVIMITAVKIDPESMKESFDAGVHDYLSKPFDNLEFVARVNATLKLQNSYLTIKKSRGEIATQMLTISKQHEELERLGSLKDKFFSIVSHDMRSPLTSLKGLLEIINDEESTLSKEDGKKFMSRLQDDLTNVLSLLDDLLFWAKSQISGEEISKKEINLSEIISETFNLFAEKINKKQLRLTNRVADATTIYADKNIISFVIRNFLINAIKFTPIGGKIMVDEGSDQEFIKISVTDTGSGIDQDTIDKLMSNSNVPSKIGTAGELGTSIGFVLCKDFIEAHEGTVFIESELGKGAKIGFRLPLTRNMQ